MNTSTPAPFEEVCLVIGSYAAIGAIFDPPVSPQGVSKWADAGIPSDRVLAIARATGYKVTPHRLRPDLYPNPTDGLPPDFVVSEAFLSTLQRDGRAA
jgi:DNA-binding transcriptional regulator YdaS (Cro superfamily)